MQITTPPNNEVHLSPQVARSDIAAPVYDEFSVLSVFSLAVLEDTGWYVVNMSAAQHMQWGRGLPVSFLRNAPGTQAVCPVSKHTQPCGHHMH